MNLKAKLGIILVVLYPLSLVLTSLFTNVSLLIFPYFVFLIPIVYFIFRVKQKEKSIYEIKLSSSNSSSLLKVWLILTGIQLISLFLNSFTYPYSPNLFLLNTWFLGFILAAILINSTFKFKNAVFLTQLAICFLSFNRFFLALFLLALFISDNSKNLLKRWLKLVPFAVVIFLSTIYLRTTFTTNNLEFNSSEFFQVLNKSIERPTFSFQTDSRVLQSDRNSVVISTSDLVESLIPRIFFKEKKSFEPGLDIKTKFWPEFNHNQNRIPIGFVGSHYLIFGDYFWFSLFVHGLVIALIIRLIILEIPSYLKWIAIYFVITQFLISEHAVFYVSAWLRVFPAFLIAFGLIYKINKTKTVMLLYSENSEFGGIQRIKGLIKKHFQERNIDFKEFAYLGNSKLSKVLFGLKVLLHSVFYKTVLATHVQFLKIFSFIKLYNKMIVLTHGIELENEIKSTKSAVDVVFSNSLATSNNNPFKKAHKQFIVPYPFLWIGNDSKEKILEPIVLMVGRLSEHDLYKGYEKVIDAWKTIQNKVPNAKLKIIGDGNLKNRLTELIENNNLSSSVILTGFLSDSELKISYKSASCLILPSTKEGQGLVYFEAMSAGIPVIGLQSSVLSEFIQHKKEGLLIDDTIESIQESLFLILSDADLAQEMGKNAYSRAFEIHQKNEFFELLETELNDVWNSRSN